MCSPEKLFRHLSVHSTVVLACQAKVGGCLFGFLALEGEFSICTALWERASTAEGPHPQSGGRLPPVTTNSHPQEGANDPIFSTDPCTKCFPGCGVGLSIQQRQERSEFMHSQLGLTALCALLEPWIVLAQAGTSWSLPLSCSCSTKPTFTWNFFPVFMESLALVL